MHRGGESIQAPRGGRTRLIASLAALACAASVAVYPAVSAGRLPWLAPALGAAAVALLAVSLVARSATGVAWSLALLGAEYATWLVLGTDAVNTRAPLVGAGIFLAAELAYDAIEPPVAPPGLEIVLRRLVLLAGLALGAVGLGALVLGVTAVPLGGGVILTAVGVVAAVAAFVLIARLAAGSR